MGGNGIEKKSFRSSPPHTVATRHRDVGSDIGYSSVDEALTELRLSLSHLFLTDTMSAVDTYVLMPCTAWCDVMRSEVNLRDCLCINRCVYCGRGTNISLHHTAMRDRCDEHHARCRMPTARRVQGRKQKLFQVFLSFLPPLSFFSFTLPFSPFPSFSLRLEDSKWPIWGITISSPNVENIICSHLTRSMGSTYTKI